jgi:hypothetical protein
VVHRGGYRVVANFGKERRTFPLPAARLIYATGDAVQLNAADVELPPQSAVIVQIS